MPIPEMAARCGEAIWFACSVNADTVLDGIPSDQKCTLRDEDLTGEPAESLEAVCATLECEPEPVRADPYSALGAIAQGAGGIKIHFIQRVEHKQPSAVFFELGSSCRELVDHYGY